MARSRSNFHYIVINLTPPYDEHVERMHNIIFSIKTTMAKIATLAKIPHLS